MKIKVFRQKNGWAAFEVHGKVYGFAHAAPTNQEEFDAYFTPRGEGVAALLRGEYSPFTKAELKGQRFVCEVEA